MPRTSFLKRILGGRAMKRALGLGACWLTLLTAGELRASGPTGLYVLVEQVIVEAQGAKEPERVKIKVVFMNELDNQNANGVARKPKTGWMVFKLSQGKEALCRAEWKDLKALAGQNKVVAFGSAHAPYLKYRVADTVH